MLSGSTISSDLGKDTVTIDDTNFMAASENSLGTWTTIWPDLKNKSGSKLSAHTTTQLFNIVE